MATIFWRLIGRMAADDPPRWVRKVRRWRFPTSYCAFVQLVGIGTLLLRPLRPQVTGATYPGFDTVRECYPLAGAMCLGILLAAMTPDDPDFGCFLFVIMTAFIRGSDALHPLSIVPLWAYVCLLIPWQFCALMEWQPVVWAGRRMRGRDAHPPG